MGSSKICMNTLCGVKTTVQWKKAWELKSGENADLCYNCGSVYDNLVYCETFHAEETGWRECSLCNKRLHCGCSASSRLIVIQDFGGVWCNNCSKAAICHSPIKDGVSSEARASVKYSNASDVQNTQFSNKIGANTINNGNLLAFGNFIEASINRFLPQAPPELMNGSFEQITPEATNSLVGVGGLDFPNLSPALNGPTLYAQPNEVKSNSGVKDMQETKMPSLNISLCSPSEISNIGLNFSSGVEEEENNKSTLIQSGQKPRKILPKPPKQNVAKASDVNKNSISPMRVPRPPAEGRLRNQLLPRYWPKITDEELQKVSGDLNSKIVPLFEKVLSASDASRIGRLVLPKACAEAYFPTINQSEGVPLNVRDIKGNDWTFQFRFWPNNNSRMYVLEGITPCIQSMQLQAGDTVIFSRIDPGGKLVIGCRKASNTEVQDPQTSSNPNGAAAGDSCNPYVPDTLSIRSGQNGPQSTGDAKEDQPSIVPEHSNLVNGNSSWGKSEKMKGKVNEDVLEHPKLPSEKKRMRNISSKSRRLHMNDDDAMEIKMTWDETYHLIRPPPNVSANIVRIDDYEFEEYTEPPVIGKRTVFTTALSGGQLQWAQCDKCSKWRKLPSDVYLPPQWNCTENIWDSTRSSCSSPEETNANVFDNVIKGKDSKKRKVAESPKQGCEPSGLDALATAATLGDHEEPSAGATTTRHPRHRPGCTCIVCIQPPSGKGKHKPSCVCNVCSTVKRRFKTLAMRKKKRLGDKEAADMALQKGNKKQAKEPKLSKQALADGTMSNTDHVVNEQSYPEIIQPSEEGESSTSKGHIDLNSHPTREEDAPLYAQPSMGIMALAQAAGAPIDMYMTPNGITNLHHPQPMDTDSCLFQESRDYVDRLLPNEEHHASETKEQGPSKAAGKGSSKPAIDKWP